MKKRDQRRKRKVRTVSFATRAQSPTPLFFEFGDFVLDTANRILTREDGTPVPLTPKAFATLSYLVQHSGATIPCRLLLKAVWPDRGAKENSLQRNIVAVRKALGGKSDQYRYIVTVQGDGYWFRAKVKACERIPNKAAAA